MTNKEDTISDLEVMRADVEARAAEEAEQLDKEQPAKTGSGGLDDPKFIMECLANNERGDGILYAAMHRGQYVYVKSRDEKAKAWFRWCGHHWAIDKGDFHHAAVEAVALKYQEQADSVSERIAELREELETEDAKASNCKAADDQEGRIRANKAAEKLSANIKRLTDKRKSLYRRVDRLRSLRGAKNCLEYAHKIGKDGLFIYGDEVDQKPMLLPCANGVIDLETGELVNGRPEDYLVRAIPVAYQGIDTPAPIWEQMIYEIHNEDQELVDFVHRFLGSCITGIDTDQVYACFIGEGANGKGTMFEVLREILGELSWSINSELLLDSKIAKSPDGPSPATMALQGRRLVVASEVDEGRKISAKNVKLFTGGDTLTGRNLFDKFDTNFKPTHKLVLYVNHAPRGLAADFALKRRLLYITYQLRYVDDVEYHARQEPQQAHLFRKKDPNLKRKLLAEREGILAWLVRGCLLWQDGGLKIPDSIRAAVEEVARKEDYIGQFIEAVCTHVEASDGEHKGITFKALYERFAKWYKDEIGAEEKYLISKRKFGESLRKKGYLMPDPRTSSGKQGVCGITFEDAGYDDQFLWDEVQQGGRGK